MRSCCCVCRLWNAVISNSIRLDKKRNQLDVQERIKLKSTFSGHDGLVPFGICYSPEKKSILVSDHRQHKIVVFGRDSWSFGSYGREKGQFDCPMGICVSQSKIFVCDSKNTRIQIFDTHDYSFISSIDTGGDYPYWICVSPNGNIMVTTDQENVLVFNSSGTAIGQFGSHGRGPGQLFYPRGICCNSRGEIIIVDGWNHRVQIYDKKGDFLRSIGAKGEGPEQLLYPRGICLDEKENILIADTGNQRINSLTPYGQSIQQVSADNSVTDFIL